MQVIGDHILDSLRRGSLSSAKFVINESAASFFDASQQHKDQKPLGLSYADDYKGNALAGTVGGRRMDIRFHEKFSDERVRNIICSLLSDSRLAFMKEWQVYYQARDIKS